MRLDPARPNSLMAYHLISRCTARPAPMSKTSTIGMAATVRPNSAVFFASTTMSSYNKASGLHATRKMSYCGDVPAW